MSDECHNQANYSVTYMIYDGTQFNISSVKLVLSLNIDHYHVVKPSTVQVDQACGRTTKLLQLILIQYNQIKAVIMGTNLVHQSITIFIIKGTIVTIIKVTPLVHAGKKDWLLDPAELTSVMFHKHT